MISYHLCRARDVAQRLADGLLRSEGRHYVYDRWHDAQLVLGALAREPAAEEYVALVLEVDDDMLAVAPISPRRLPPGLRPDDVKQLQARSRYAEVDINAARIVDVKDTIGNSVLRRFRPEARGRAPIWRFLAFAKPYWKYVAAATGAGLLKFLLPLAFPWMLKVLLDEVVLKEGLDPAVRSQTTLYLVLAILGVNMVWMIAT